MHAFCRYHETLQDLEKSYQLSIMLLFQWCIFLDAYEYGNKSVDRDHNFEKTRARDSVLDPLVLVICLLVIVLFSSRPTPCNDPRNCDADSPLVIRAPWWIGLFFGSQVLLV